MISNEVERKSGNELDTDFVSWSEQYELSEEERKRHYKKSLLHHAFEQGRVDYVKKLWPRDWYEVGEDEDCNTPVALAAKSGHVELVKMVPKEWLIENKFGDTPLTISASLGYLDMLKYLIHTLTPAVNAIDWRGYSLLSLAAKGGHFDCVDFLLSLGYRDDPSDGLEYVTALQHAAEHGSIEIMKLLLPLSSRENFKLACHSAISERQLDACMVLHSFDADTFYGVVEDLKNKRLLYVTFSTKDERFVIGFLELLDACKSRIGELKVWDLFFSAVHWTPSFTQQMAERRGVTLDDTIFDPLFWVRACEYGNFEMVKWLLDKYIVPSGKNDANERNITEMRITLLEKGLVELLDYMEQVLPSPAIRNDGSELPQRWLSVGARQALAGGVESLKWFCGRFEGFDNVPDAIFTVVPLQKPFSRGPEVVKYLLASGWNLENSAEFHSLRATLLNTSHWPDPLHRDAESVLESLKLMSELFNWTKEDLQRRRKEFHGPCPVVDVESRKLPPLLWAAYYRLPKVLDWLLTEKKVEYESLCGEPDASSALVYAHVYGGPRDRTVSFFDEPRKKDCEGGRLDVVPMLRHVRHISSIPLPRDATQVALAWMEPGRFNVDLVEMEETRDQVNILEWLVRQYIGEESMCRHEISQSRGISRSYDYDHPETLSEMILAFLDHFIWADAVYQTGRVFRFLREWVTSNEGDPAPLLDETGHQYINSVINEDLLQSYIFQALSTGSLKILDCFVSEGLSPLLHSKHGIYATAAALCESHRSLKWLHHHGVDICAAGVEESSERFTAVEIAATGDLPVLLQYLLSKGASVYEPTSSGSALLRVATAHGSNKVLAFLNSNDSPLR